MSEREQADRWWASKETDHMGAFSRHAMVSDPRRTMNEWWYGLPDERAVAIYKQESGQ